MPRILVIDDEAPMRRLIKRVLETAGYEVVEAANGHEGLAAFREHNPAVVVTDILMPEKEGIETIRDIRRVAPEVPVLAVSGGGKAGNLLFLELAKSLGADAALAKPFRTARLIEAVRRLVEHRPPPTDHSDSASAAGD